MIEETVRVAQRSSMAHGSPAQIHCDLQAHTVSAQVLRTVGTWHFETPELEGGGGLQGVWMGPNDAPLVANGLLGKSFDLSGAGSPGELQINVSEEPAFEWTEGFHMRFALRMQRWAAAPLLRMGDGLILAASSKGALGAEFRAQVTDDRGTPSRGSRVRVETEPGLLTPGVWVQVEVVYDRQALSIFVDGVERVRRPEQAPVWMGRPLLRLSSRETPFMGEVDRLVIAVFEVLPAKPLPAKAEFTAESVSQVVFAPGGSLDPLIHSVPAQIRWTLSDGTQQALRVGLQGTVQ